MRSAPSYCSPLSFTPAHSWRVIHHRRRPLSFLWLGWLAGLAGSLGGLLGFWLSGPWTRVCSSLSHGRFALSLSLSLVLRLLLLGPMYSFYSYTGAVPTCSSGSAGRSFSLSAYRYSRISPRHILESASPEISVLIRLKFQPDSRAESARFAPATARFEFPPYATPRRRYTDPLLRRGPSNRVPRSRFKERERKREVSLTIRVRYVRVHVAFPRCRKTLSFGSRGDTPLLETSGNRKIRDSFAILFSLRSERISHGVLIIGYS